MIGKILPGYQNFILSKLWVAAPIGSDIAFSAKALAWSIGSCSTFLLGPKPSSSSSDSDSSSASDLGGLSGSLYFSLYLALASLASVFSLLYFSVLSFSILLASAAFNLSCSFFSSRDSADSSSFFSDSGIFGIDGINIFNIIILNCLYFFSLVEVNQ